MKLISMVDFIDEIGNSTLHESYEIDLAKIYNYCTFLEQPLKLEMFVPCDEDGNILKEPEMFKEWLKSDHYFNASESVTHNCRIYKKAQEKVIFENTDCIEDDGLKYLKLTDKNHISFYNFKDKFGDKTIEDFSFNYGLIIKDSFVKRILG